MVVAGRSHWGGVPTFCPSHPAQHSHLLRCVSAPSSAPSAPTQHPGVAPEPSRTPREPQYLHAPLALCSRHSDSLPSFSPAELRLTLALLCLYARTKSPPTPVPTAPLTAPLTRPLPPCHARPPTHPRGCTSHNTPHTQHMLRPCRSRRRPAPTGHSATEGSRRPLTTVAAPPVPTTRVSADSVDHQPPMRWPSNCLVFAVQSAVLLRRPTRSGGGEAGGGRGTTRRCDRERRPVAHGLRKRRRPARRARRPPPWPRPRPPPPPCRARRTCARSACPSCTPGTNCSPAPAASSYAGAHCRPA